MCYNISSIFYRFDKFHIYFLPNFIAEVYDIVHQIRRFVTVSGLGFWRKKMNETEIKRYDSQVE